VYVSAGIVTEPTAIKIADSTIVAVVASVVSIVVVVVVVLVCR